MKSLTWFLFGVIGGFILAHVVDKDPRGHELLAEIDGRIGEFTDRMSDAYREQDAKFAGVLEETKDAPAADADIPVTPDAGIPTPREVAEHTTMPQVSALADADVATEPAEAARDDTP